MKSVRDMIAIPFSWFERAVIVRVILADLFFDETSLNKIFILEYMPY
jgi:hypothetical protein